jgi:hypothetical protein
MASHRKGNNALKKTVIRNHRLGSPVRLPAIPSGSSNDKSLLTNGRAGIRIRMLALPTRPFGKCGREQVVPGWTKPALLFAGAQ